MYVGSWCVGSGVGNLDGWNGDYSIHLLSAGIFCCSGKKEVEKKNIKSGRVQHILLNKCGNFLRESGREENKKIFYIPSHFHYMLPFKGCSIQLLLNYWNRKESLLSGSLLYHLLLCFHCALLPGWKSPVITSVGRNHLWPGAYPHVTAGQSADFPFE